MNIHSLKRTADSLLAKHGDKIERGVGSAERMAKKRVRGKDRQIDQAAARVRTVLAQQRRG